MKKLWSVVGWILLWGMPTAMLCFNFYMCGSTKGRQDLRQELRDECGCGATRTCAFGPGIVGEQHCWTAYEKNEWSRCEPVKP